LQPVQRVAFATKGDTNALAYGTVIFHKEQAHKVFRIGFSL
jgi:hypothetical protein